jgi:hypothetical protein
LGFLFLSTKNAKAAQKDFSDGGRGFGGDVRTRNEEVIDHTTQQQFKQQWRQI